MRSSVACRCGGELVERRLLDEHPGAVRREERQRDGHARRASRR